VTQTPAKIVVILGPTAVGKSDLAMQIAEAIGGAIVNADSQQVYRYMDIGTGKSTAAERQRVEHFLIDVVDPDEEFNAARYRRLAVESIAHLQAGRRQAILCGGTGLYLKALTQGLFEGPGTDGKIRCNLQMQIADEGLAPLYERLREIDPAAAAAIHANDRQRIVRALEVFRSTGKRLSEWQREHGFQERPFEALKIGLTCPRDELYETIDRRCERMIREGLLDEVRGLVDRGFGLGLKPLRSIGYRQMGQVLEGQQSLAEALKEMKQQTRHYAKRQLTWFRRDQEIRWYRAQQQPAIIESVKSFLAI
jgi:tRNA dimethylallyltransferase